jgi:hypothetical protein
MTEAEAAGSEDFAERMGHIMNEAALVLMISVGHRTGLFDVMAAMPAATSAEIASEAALDERYVREWLAVMTTGRIVDHDGVTGTLRCPPTTPPSSPRLPARTIWRYRRSMWACWRW